MPFSNIQRNLDTTKGQGTSKIRSLLQGFVTSRFFFVLYFTITGVQKIVRYTENFVIKRFFISRFVMWGFVIPRISLYRGSLNGGLRYIVVRYTEDFFISRENEVPHSLLVI